MRKIFIILLLTVALSLSWIAIPTLADDSTPFSFAVTADMRYCAGPDYNSSNYFHGAMEAIQALGGSAFMLSPGDIDPVDDVKWTIEQVMGTNYLWYPVVGNHELPGAGHEAYAGQNMNFLRGYDYDQNGSTTPPDVVNSGPSGCPETTYAFDYGNSHFVVLNEYCDIGGDTVTVGDVSDHLYDWLITDLQATIKKYIFVVGHEPAFPQPDADNGRLRHEDDSLNQYPANRNRFWNLLRDEGVVAYICGHTHNFSAYFHDGVWQLDTGHARGIGDDGAASTFMMIHVYGDKVTFNAYRDIHDNDYDYDDIIHSGTLYNDNTPTPDLMTFQDAVAPDAGYFGTSDTVLSQADPNTNFGADVFGLADGDDPPGTGTDLSTLIHWDISAIPAASTVEDVTIYLNVFNKSNDTYHVFEMKRDWVESEAAWNVYSSGNSWQIPGGRGLFDSGSTVLGTFTPVSTGMYSMELNSHGVSLVQSWVDNPASNRGLIIANSSAIDGIDFDSSEVGIKINRPKLSIFYIPRNDCLGADRDTDGDVDGSDLAVVASQGTGIAPDLVTFADEFGRTDCSQH